MTPKIQSFPEPERVGEATSQKSSECNVVHAIDPQTPRKNQTFRLTIWLSVLTLAVAIVAVGVLIRHFSFPPVTEDKSTLEKHQRVGLAVANFRLNCEQPPSNSFDASGAPLLSWRVHLLPYLGQEALYLKFKLDEPWDSPCNIQLLGLMPEVYRSENEENSESGMTMLRAFSSPGSVMEALESFQSTQRLNENGMEQKRFSETQITDGEENTIFAVESGDPVEWTKPENMMLAIGEPLPTFGGKRQTNDFYLITLDGAALRMSKSIGLMQLKALITIAGGETFDFDDRKGVVVVKNLREPIFK